MNMTPEKVYQILNAATQPQTAGQITREGYVQIQQALDGVAEMGKQLSAMRQAMAEKEPLPPAENA